MIIVPLTFIRIAKDIIGLFYILEDLGGVLIGVFIGMPLECGLFIALFYVFLGTISLEFQQLIVTGFHRFGCHDNISLVYNI
jgi:hypothetical protein